MTSELSALSRVDYDAIKESGMLYEYFPQATGDFDLDTNTQTAGKQSDWKDTAIVDKPETYEWPSLTEEVVPHLDKAVSAMEGQVGGSHYKDMLIQPWMIIDCYSLSYYEGSALEYLLRTKENRLQDLQKCRHYLDKMIEDLQK